LRSPEAMRTTAGFVDLSGRLLSRGRAMRFVAEGWSMHPAIRDGEKVEVVPVALAEIRRGDILLCRVGPALVAHRVVRIDDWPSGRPGGLAGDVMRQIVLRGDSSFADDAPLEVSRILGRVTAVLRHGRAVPLATPAARVFGLLGARAWRAKRRLAEAIRRAPRRAPSSARTRLSPRA
jgi:hypothetical protein